MPSISTIDDAYKILGINIEIGNGFYEDGATQYLFANIAQDKDKYDGLGEMVLCSSSNVVLQKNIHYNASGRTLRIHENITQKRRQKFSKRYHKYRELIIRLFVWIKIP